ncbi:MAG: hypothetical protein RLY31_572 [Bacteroidota bacterium]|jgi:lipopolysaccharide transport system permease protein/teichoic acid transport system permease protein
MTNRAKVFFGHIRYFLKDLVGQRSAILALSRRDFKRKYIRHFFGLVWAVLDPFLFVSILYFVFQSRFGGGLVEGIPYVVYMLCGYVVLDIYNTQQQIITVVRDHQYLLKKVHFRISSLPIIRLLSNLLMHGVILAVTVVVLLANEIHPSLYWLQLAYYVAAVSTLLVGLGLITSSVYLFFPDIANIMGIANRMMVFITPIFWRSNDVPDTVALLLKLNPLCYVIQGYRDSFLYERGFWEHPLETLYFWTVSGIVLFIGIKVFRRLRPHFAEIA